METNVVEGPGRHPSIEVGRQVSIRGLKKRLSLNGKPGAILRMPDPETGRVAVRVFRDSKDFEDVLVKPENLVVHWSSPEGASCLGEETEVCPICMETDMDAVVGENRNASVFVCCGKKVCHECWYKILEGPNPETCPMCRADTSDTRDEATIGHIRRRAERGDASAQYNLACHYDFGTMGVDQDQVEARRLYKLAADQSHARAANDFAVSCRDGDGGPVDYEQALKYFRVGSNLGHVSSMTNLGCMYMSGQGGPRNLLEAKRLFTKAADEGSELSKTHLETLNEWTDAELAADADREG